MNRLASSCRTASHIEEQVFVFAAMFSITLRNIQRNGLSGIQPLVATTAIDAGK
jgi:hypothetical protein